MEIQLNIMIWFIILVASLVNTSLMSYFVVKNKTNIAIALGLIQTFVIAAAVIFNK